LVDAFVAAKAGPSDNLLIASDYEADHALLIRWVWNQTLTVVRL